MHDALLARLIDADLAPGASLNIDMLARELGVSPTPVREALARLDSTGLVERTASRGYSVTPAPTAKDIADLMDARLLLEPVNALNACLHADTDFLQTLESVVSGAEQLELGTSFESFREYWAADERFHMLIAEQAGSAPMLASYRALGGLALRFRQFSGTGVTDARTALAEHRAVLAAFHEQNPALAQAEMARHIEAVKTRSLVSFSDEAAPQG